MGCNSSRRCRHTDGDGPRLSVGGQPPLSDQRTFQTGVFSTAEQPIHTANGRGRQFGRSRQFDVSDIAPGQRTSRRTKCRASPPSGTQGGQIWNSSQDASSPCSVRAVRNTSVSAAAVERSTS